MNPLTPDHVQRHLDSFDLGLRVVHFDQHTTTSEDAARAIGCSLGQIAKSICLMVDGRPVLVVASGDRKVAEAKLARHFQVGRKKIRIATADQCCSVFGYLPGGVAPVAHRTPAIPVLIDRDLRRWPVIHAAAGTAHDNFALTFDQLEVITGGTVLDCTAPIPGPVAGSAAGAQTPERLTHLLAEREKELDALYRLATLFGRPVTSRTKLAEQAARTLREAMQVPRCTRVEIVQEGLPPLPRQAGEVVDSHCAKCSCSIDKELQLTVSYVAGEGGCAGVAIDERERRLIDSTAQLLAEALDRHEMEQTLRESTRTLQRQAAELERKNIALSEVLSQIEQEKRAALRDAKASVDAFVRPYLRQLSTREMSEGDRGRLGQIEATLDRLFTGSESTLSGLTQLLTPREAEICSLIRNGLSSKEISAFLHICESTVERHRNTIRKKLSLTGTPTNLTSYLRSRA